MNEKWTHDALAADLLDCRHLAGEIAIERLGVRGGQLDVAAMRLSWTRPVLTGYEVKISRSDFLSDIRSEKWRNYLPSVERLFFCVPKGMLDEREIPPECGYMTRGERSWRWVRAAPQREMEVYHRAVFVQSLLFRHYPASWQPGANGMLRLDGARVSARELSTGMARDYYGRERPLTEILEQRRDLMRARNG